MSETEQSGAKPDQVKGLWEGLRDGAVKYVGATLAGYALSAGVAGAVATWAALKTWVVVEIPSGLVVASASECRDLRGGWKDFQAAAGRFIIGAGPHSANPGVTKSYDVFKNEGDTPRAGLEKSTCGEERHLIQPNELPKLYVEMEEYSGHGGHAAKYVSYQPQQGQATLGLMPPYVALHYCLKQ